NDRNSDEWADGVSMTRIVSVRRTGVRMWIETKERQPRADTALWIDIKLSRKKNEDRMPIFFFQAEDGIRDLTVTGVQTCALPISAAACAHGRAAARAQRRRGDRRRPAPRRWRRGAPPARPRPRRGRWARRPLHGGGQGRSEEHTSELQSQSNLVCRLLLEKKKKEI